MLGKHVLVGITYVDAEGRQIEQREYHGAIESADERDGFAVRIDDRTIEWLPPDVTAFSAAEPGEYRLRSTGEVVTNPDLLSTWILERHSD